VFSLLKRLKYTTSAEEEEEGEEEKGEGCGFVEEEAKTDAAKEAAAFPSVSEGGATDEVVVKTHDDDEAAAIASGDDSGTLSAGLICKAREGKIQESCQRNNNHDQTNDDDDDDNISSETHTTPSSRSISSSDSSNKEALNGDIFHSRKKTHLKTDDRATGSSNTVIVNGNATPTTTVDGMNTPRAQSLPSSDFSKRATNTTNPRTVACSYSSSISKLQSTVSPTSTSTSTSTSTPKLTLTDSGRLRRIAHFGRLQRLLAAEQLRTSKYTLLFIHLIYPFYLFYFFIYLTTHFIVLDFASRHRFHD
jgi:hypothetical protein